ncbi:hypothetical protein SK803_44920 [Lentzea sp. BCCO 10_0856]|uniref:Tetratricopeptide repeat protein n=1 Tax=Lentzea miocenica TaxID=3095431 RepID=A0ABU4TGQ2_9PSEU|nr:hypothetical protein [Lentzea sp. BCCO 10_0856]MDX8037382.1 hypothetical protein [Lentzea sp. BCCO 10_0856]
MVREVRPALVLITAIVAVLVAAPAHGATEDDPITVVLPSGTVLPPGRYEAGINTGSGTVRAEVVVPGTPVAPQSSAVPSGQSTPDTSAPAAGQTTAPAAVAPSSGPSAWPVIWTTLLAILGTILVLAGGLVGYRRFLVPRKQIREYRAVVEQVRGGELQQALLALERLEPRLPERLRLEARFFAAFALFRMDLVDEAEYRLAALHREAPQDVDVAYLLAYLRVERRDYDGAEPVLEAAEAAGGMSRRLVRRLYGVVKFHRALEALRLGRVDTAAVLFQKVEKLGDFAERVPPDLRNQHVVLGAQALFDRDLVAARGQFEDLARAAENAAPEQREQMLASAEIGLALAAWLDNTLTSLGQVDQLLVSAARRLDPDGDTERPWTFTPDEDSVRERLVALSERQARAAEVNDRDLTLRSIHLLRAAAGLRLWAAAKTTPAEDVGRRDEVLGRLACAREYDPEFSDPYLVAGLLKAYFSSTPQEREDGVAVLRQAQRLGVREPELVRILNEEARLGQARRDAADRYLQVLDQFIADPSVRDEVRVSLLERLSRFRKVRPLDRRPELVRARAVAPTVDEMNSRTELLRERVSQLMTVQGGGENLTAAQQLVHHLENDSRVLAEQAHSVETKEADLLVLIGDWLLGDNEG